MGGGDEEGKVDMLWAGLFLFWLSGPLCCGPLSAALCSSWVGGGLVFLGDKRGDLVCPCRRRVAVFGVFYFPREG